MRLYSILLTLIISWLAADLHGAVVVSPAEDALIKKLLSSGLKVGYDKDRERMVFLGVMVREMKDPANDPAFLLKRSMMFKVAEAKARHALMDYVEKDVSASEQVRAYVDGCTSVVENISCFSTVSSMKLIACTVLASVESYVGDRYSVALAIGWSDRAERSAREALSRKDYGNTRLKEVEKWLEEYDYASVWGSRQFVDSAGFVYQVGIAASDVDGLTGLKLKTAMRKAQLGAMRELAFALCVPMLGTKDLIIKASRGVIGDSDFEAYEDELIPRIEGKIKNMKLNGVSRMHETTVRHPVTGRKMYVAVYGLTVNDQVVKMDKSEKCE